MPPSTLPTAPSWLGRLFRFGVTGLASTVIHIAVAAWLITHLGVLPYVANPIAFLTATSFAYASNTLWSFSSQLSRRTLWPYACVSTLSCLATAGVSAGAAAAQLDYRVGILLVILVVTPANFAMHNLWTYRRSKLPGDATPEFPITANGRQ